MSKIKVKLSKIFHRKDNKEQREKLNEFLVRIKDLQWKMKDGKKVRVGEMQTSHIQRCVDMLGKNKKFVEYWLKVFEFELKYRAKVNREIEKFDNIMIDMIADEEEQFLAPEVGDN